jgi:hypothetical protein
MRNDGDRSARVDKGRKRSLSARDSYRYRGPQHRTTERCARLAESV